MKNILVLTDFSKEANYALDFAFQLAEKTQRRIHVLNVIEIPLSPVAEPMGAPIAYTWTADFIKEMTETSQESLEAAIEKYRKKGMIDYKVEVGSILYTTLDYIEKHNIDLVVMGTKGASGLREIFIGSNAEKVVRFSPCPVITMSHPAVLGDMEDIVFGLDLNGDEKKVVPELKTLQELLGVKIHFIHIAQPHVFENEERDLSKVHLFCRENEFENYSVNVRKSFQREFGIIEFTTEKQADMIAMASSHRKGLAHFFQGSLAEDLVNHSPIPVWTFSLKD